VKSGGEPSVSQSRDVIKFNKGAVSVVKIHDTRLHRRDTSESHAVKDPSHLLTRDSNSAEGDPHLPALGKQWFMPMTWSAKSIKVNETYEATNTDDNKRTCEN